MSNAMSEREPIEWPAEVNAIQIDRLASSLTYSIDEKKLPPDTGWLMVMRDQIARGLEASSTSGGAPLPIRFKAEVHGTAENVILSRCVMGIGWFYWGCPNHEVSASARITFDIQGKLYHGAGQATDTVHAVWYNNGKVTVSEIAAYGAIIEATRAALAASPYVTLTHDLERHIAGVWSDSRAWGGSE